MASYRLHRTRPLPDELRRAAHDQLERGLQELDGDDLHHGVHQVRKRCKKLRALVRLLHRTDPALSRRENAAFRDTARRLSDLRDHAALVEAFDGLAAHASLRDETGQAVRAALVDRRDTAAPASEAAVAAVRRELTLAGERVARWPLPDTGFDLVSGGLHRTYRRARRRLDTAAEQRTTESFHEWRKRVKDHRYQLRLLQDVWPPVLRAHRRELHALGELLGDDHDLAVLRTALDADPGGLGGAVAVAEVRVAVDQRRQHLQDRAVVLGRRSFAEAPDAFVRRLDGYWQARDAEVAGQAG